MAEVARDAVLSLIRNQLSAKNARAADHASEDVTSEYRSIHRDYHRAGVHSAEENIALFIDRLEDYDATVMRTPESGVGAAVGELLKSGGYNRVLVPAAYPASWLPAEIQILRDKGASDKGSCDEGADGPALSNAELDQIHAVLTTCTVAIATTGTLLLQHTAEQGRRAITLLPDYYVCVVRASQIVETVPEGFARIDSPQLYPITTVSGPSATADIEMTRIRGVHGPRHLGIVIVDGL